MWPFIPPMIPSSLDLNIKMSAINLHRMLIVKLSKNFIVPNQHVQLLHMQGKRFFIRRLHFRVLTTERTLIKKIDKELARFN